MKNTRYSRTSNPTLAYHVRDSMQGNLDNTLTIILIFFVLVDFIHTIELQDSNHRISYLFTGIDTFSKRAWVIPCIKADAKSVVRALRIIFNTILR